MIDEKYIQPTKSGKWAVVFPESIKTPRRLGTFENIDDAIFARDAYLAKHQQSDDAPHIKKDERLNTATIEAVGRIVTLEQLLEFADVDLDVWDVERWIINKWEVGAKTEYKDLEFNDGRLSGTIKADGLEIEPLIQVKAWLIRKKPIAIFPTIQSIKFIDTFQYPQRAQEPNYTKFRRAMIIADPQIGFRKDIQTAKLTPFHDRKALDIALQIANVAMTDDIIFVGDFLDLTEWTDRFLRDPEFTHTTQPAINEGFWWLREFVKSSGAVILIDGNHEDRMNSAIITHLRAAYGLRPADELGRSPALSVNRLLALDALGIKHVTDYPNGEYWLNDGLRAIHGDRAQAPGSTGRAVANDSDVSTAYGHIHRPEIVSRMKRVRGGYVQIASICPGCVCHIDGRVPGHTNTQEWAKGIALIDYDITGTAFTPQIIRIEDDAAIYDRMEFVGRDRVDEIAACFDGWNF